MLTGALPALTPFDSVLQGIGLLHWLLALLVLVLVLFKIKSPLGKAIGVIVVIALFSYLSSEAGLPFL